SAGVVLTVSFQQVYNAPDAEAGTERYNQRLQYIDCTVEKLHLKTRSRAAYNTQTASPAPASFHFLLNESSRYVLGFLGFVRCRRLILLCPNLHRLSRRRRTPRRLSA